MPSSHTSSDCPSSAIDSESLTSQTVCQPPSYYQFAISLLKPAYRLQVWRRSHKRDNYRQEVEQRFGKNYPSVPVANAEDASLAPVDMLSTDKGIVWCHAVSLGETNTVAPLLDMLLASGYQIWLTNTTQTGFARGASRFADEIAQGRVSHSYVPVDSPAVIERFLAHVKPDVALFVETELWANILTKLSEHRIPSILVNGRLSASSFTRYQKIGAVSRSMMKNLALIIAQDNESAKRFRQLGADSAKIRVAGSLKWVINTPKNNTAHSNGAVIDAKTVGIKDEYQHIQHQKIELATEFGVVGRPIWVAASTHGGEEEIALSLHKQLLSNPALADALLIIVPRHPERFDEVAALIQSTELTMARRSAEESISADTRVYLADSMGELMTWYQLADVALVGGSLVDVGGHNPVEPASIATPVLMGRNTQSCQTVVDRLSEVGALYQPSNTFYRPVSLDMASTTTLPKAGKNDDVPLIYQQLLSWLSHLDVAKQAGQAGAQLTVQKQAVLVRQFTMIEDVIEQYSNQELL
ncbi:3-deoxy-D-manno-octulosonic acid transferase [Psychrobacter fjordensis]|uniref:3-deoxy-D-manno-octulosonic acid transferase n=1 Tax=Psychrobacter fjordensis TaxID=664424 RepID=UPI00191B73E9|nr:3-deoxy-D-manno-octulosonic acid transferase [Psychrobacter fjordensis]